MRIRDRLTYANVMATIAVFGVLAGSGAYAASKIGTKDIAQRAVTSPKLAKSAVTAPKLASGAVKSGKLADRAVKTNAIAASADGVALSGLRMLADGTYLTWFNRLGGAPGVQHPSPGRYVITWPGWSASTSVGVVRNVTQAEGAGGTVQAFLNSSAAGSTEVVLTRDQSGVLADRAFNYVAYATSRRFAP